VRQDADTLRAIAGELATAWDSEKPDILRRFEACLARLVAAAETPEDRPPDALGPGFGSDVVWLVDEFRCLHAAAAETTPASQVLSAENLTAEAAEPPVAEVCGSAMIACSLPAGHESYHRAAAGQIWYGPYYDKPATTTATQSSPEVAVDPSVAASERLTAIRRECELALDPSGPTLHYANGNEFYEDVAWLLGLVDTLTAQRDDTGSVISALEGAKRWAARAAAAEAAADTARQALQELTDAADARANLADTATSSSNPAVRREAEKIRIAHVDAAARARQVLAEPQGTSLGGAADAAPGSGGEA
jgi:hypothetical protein